MNFKNIIGKSAIIILALMIAVSSCQKLERPVLKELILDPPPPPYNELASFWSFENSIIDGGESKMAPVLNNITYVAGVTGQAAKIGTGGYILLKGMDTVTYPNGFKGISGDTLKNLGSFTLSFWMNGVGPVPGAQGVFAISNKKEFWGNLEIFLEGHNNPANASEAFLKIHMFNAGVASGNGEEWNELKIPILNKWSHIALTYDAATSMLSLYANGAVTSINNKILGGGKYGKVKFNDFNGMVLGNFAFQTNPTLTSHGPEPWANAFNGALDQFRIYKRALSTAEITDLFTTKK